MTEFNADDFKCRCSAINDMMSNSRDNKTLTEKQALRLKELESKDAITEKQKEELADLLVRKENGKKVILSDTCIDYLMLTYSIMTTGKVDVRKEIDIDYLVKGRMVEEESIMLLSIVEDVPYTKNEERVSNDYLSGEPDIFVGEEIMKAKKITDIKSCFDYPIFLKKINKGLENGWEDQVQGYCDITGASEGEIAHCLVNMPTMMINDYKKRLFYKGDYATDENPEFKKRWELLERSMIFDDIPMHQRIFKIKVSPFTPERKQQVYDKVKICREWLNKFHEMYLQLNIPVTEMV